MLYFWSISSQSFREEKFCIFLHLIKILEMNTKNYPICIKTYHEGKIIHKVINPCGKLIQNLCFSNTSLFVENEQMNVRMKL